MPDITIYDQYVAEWENQSYQEIGPRIVTDRVLARFFSRVDASGDCWEWTGAKHKAGYGNFSVSAWEKLLAHRAAYVFLVEELPEHIDLHHQCRNLLCVNPDHMQPVPHTLHKSLHKKAYCLRGHKRTADNVDVVGRCRTCRRLRQV